LGETGDIGRLDEDGRFYFRYRKAERIRVSDEELRVLCIAVVGAVNQSVLSWLLSGYEVPRRVLVAANARLLTAGLASVEDK